MDWQAAHHADELQIQHELTSVYDRLVLINVFAAVQIKLTQDDLALIRWQFGLTKEKA